MLRNWRMSLDVGGARRNRTDDLFNAIEALSQLSYGPAPAPLLWAAESLRYSGFLVGSDVAIDEVGDVVVVLFFFLQERIIDGVVLGVVLDIDVVAHRLDRGLL